MTTETKKKKDLREVKQLGGHITECKREERNGVSIGIM